MPPYQENVTMRDDFADKENTPPASRDALELAYRMFKKLLDLSKDGFIAIDKNNKIIEINNSYCEWLGVTYEEALTRKIEELTPNTKLPRVRDQGRSEHNVLHYLRDGRLKGAIVAVSRSPVRKDGEAIAAIGQICYPKTTAEMAHLLRQAYHESGTGKDGDRDSGMGRYSFDNIIGQDPHFLSIKRRAQKAASMDLTVLLLGETGTGKELFAHAIHNASPRANQPLICVNCSAIPGELLESELFGYQDGAFTGANRRGKIGKIEMANKGTLFLDEIGDMPMHMQAKLLRILQEKELEPLGSTQKRKVDIRVIAATNANLDHMIADKTFRADLFFRLSVVNLVLPPLRDHPDDAPLLAQYYLDNLNRQFGGNKELSGDAKAMLRLHTWPGNARELRNAMELAFGFTEHQQIQPKDFPAHIYESTAVRAALESRGGSSLEEMLALVERKIIRQTLEKHAGNYAKAARELGLHRATLYKKVKQNKP